MKSLLALQNVGKDCHVQQRSITFDTVLKTFFPGFISFPFIAFIISCTWTGTVLIKDYEGSKQKHIIPKIIGKVQVEQRNKTHSWQPKMKPTVQRATSTKIQKMH